MRGHKQALGEVYGPREDISDVLSEDIIEVEVRLMSRRGHKRCHKWRTLVLREDISDVLSEVNML